MLMGTDKPQRIIVIAPCHNEARKICDVVRRVKAMRERIVQEMLVVDDASSDGSGDVARGLGATVERLPQPSGVGAALRRGLRYAHEKGYDIAVIMAGNNKDEPDEIPALVRPILEDGCDLVQGSRYMRGGQLGNMPLYRRFATRLHPLLFSLFVGKRLTESTNGFRAVRLGLLDDARINLDQPWLDQYELEPYLLFKAIQLGYKHAEVPCTKIYPPKELGQTKMKPVTGWWSILRPVFLLGLGLRK
jgi:glycosyltransferase involved in cell wall biosynthesis